MFTIHLQKSIPTWKKSRYMPTTLWHKSWVRLKYCQPQYDIWRCQCLIYMPTSLCTCPCLILWDAIKKCFMSEIEIFQPHYENKVSRHSIITFAIYMPSHVFHYFCWHLKPSKSWYKWKKILAFFFCLPPLDLLGLY